MKPAIEWQRGLQYFNGCFFLPNSVDGTGAWDAWNAGDGTVTHATVGSNFDTQFKRTIYSNDGTINRALGVRKSNTGDYQFYLGNKRFCGGFYFSTIFRIEAWAGTGAGTDGRLFIGLTAGANANVISDTLQNNSIGLFHKGTDGANDLNFVSRNNAGSELSNVMTDATHGVGTLAAGNTLLFEMWHFPNAIEPNSSGMTGTTVNAKLSLFDVATTSGGSIVDGLALNRVKKIAWTTLGFNATRPTTTMMAPQVQMSNGGTDTTVGHYSIGIANVYVAPWSGEMD